MSNRQISTVSFCFMDVPPPCLNASRKNAGPYPAWGRVQRRTSDCSSRPRRLHHPLRLHPPPRRIWATSHDASVAVGWAGCWRTSTAAAGGGEDSDSTRGRRSWGGPVRRHEGGGQTVVSRTRWWWWWWLWGGSMAGGSWWWWWRQRAGVRNCWWCRTRIWTMRLDFTNDTFEKIGTETWKVKSKIFNLKKYSQNIFVPFLIKA